MLQGHGWAVAEVSREPGLDCGCCQIAGLFSFWTGDLVYEPGHSLCLEPNLRGQAIWPSRLHPGDVAAQAPCGHKT